ncbi:hypothetical protein [Micromonospora pattaloongensis]|uniref:hypothetical protein n=1 Tax=Micromonospora pattaloongensis TaxID=405436 RepID=UPI000B8816FD|nr:hypothetical protein [Micromonospora pattaloongensis]
MDTLLFVDPFLLFADKSEEWATAHDNVMEYFHSAFELLAKSGMRRGQLYDRVLTLMLFPEPREFRLGYTAKSTDGAGAGKGLAKQVVGAMGEAINRGLDDISHFEELGILVDRFNRDRISDVICNLLKPRFISYTQRVCEELEIPTEEVEVPHATFNEMRNRWMSERINLPVDEKGKPVILTPKRFLRELPTLSADNWYDHLDTSLRDDLNLRISGQVRKSDILAAARANIGTYRMWIQAQENRHPEPYDVDLDPKLYVQWQRVAKMAAESFPQARQRVIHSETEMLAFIDEVVGYVQHWVERDGGWRLFWKDAPKQTIPETNMQILFLGMVKQYCKAAGIRIDREVETGKGPVDFAFSGDGRLRVLIEMKKLTHGEFWNGLFRQTPEYVLNLEVKDAVFLAIKNSTTKPMRKRWAELELNAAEVRRNSGLNIRTAKIDIMPKLSASKDKGVQSDEELGEEDGADPESGMYAITDDLDNETDDEGD